MLKTIPAALLVLALTPTSALAHSGVKHRQSESIPRLELLVGENKIDPSRPEIATQEMAAVAWRGNLRIVIQRSKQGTRAFQRVGKKRYPLPEGSAALSQGLKNGIGLELSREGQVLQRRTLTWCPSGSTPLRDNDLSPTQPIIPGCGARLSRYIETGIDQGWADSFSGQPFTPLQYSIGNGGPETQDRPLNIPEPGSYKIKITLDPNRMLHLSSRSKLSKVFDMEVTQAFYDSMISLPELPPVEAASKNPGILPDLQVMPATDLSLSSGGEPGMPADQTIPEFLSFSSLVWNDSKGRLVVSGRRSRPESKSMAAYQTITDQNGKARRTLKIGRLVWNNSDGHSHWHYDGLARYRILKEDGTRVADSGKIGFCFVNTTPVDSRLFPPYQPNTQDYGNLGCGMRWSLAVSMEMDGGWGDLYNQSVAGQAFETTGLPNGKYILEVKANAGPYAKIREKSLNNNISHRRFEILGEPNQRYLEVEPWEGDSFDPGMQLPLG